MSSTRIPVTRWPGTHTPTGDTDSVAIEEPLEIRVNGRSVAVTMRTPGHDRELAAGFLLSENLIKSAADLIDVLICRDLPDGQSGNVVDVLLAPGIAVDYAKLTRHVFGSSSCGLCGKATIDSVMQSLAPVSAGPSYLPTWLATLPARLRAAQPGFHQTGGLHASALFSHAGELLCVREDVGRHNALDKVLGWAFLANRLPLHDSALLVSGRISFELVQKALAAGIPLIAGIGAPSSLAVECARRGEQTLIGFLREDRFNVYAGPERISEQGAGAG